MIVSKSSSNSNSTNSNHSASRNQGEPLVYRYLSNACFLQTWRISNYVATCGDPCRDETHIKHMRQD